MTTQWRHHRAEFKAKGAREALRGERTIGELAPEYRIHPVPVTQWKNRVLEEVSTLLSIRHGAKSKQADALKAALYQQIGPLKVELD